jgi:adenylosuccinate synthase
LISLLGRRAEENRMALDIIVGSQWGDEGKGRVVDLLASEADIVARYNGGDNAGHTVTVGEQTFKLHLIPSGIIQPHTEAVIGNGLVVNLSVLAQEIDSLRNAGVNVNPDRLHISHAAHIITPAHRALDQAQETARGKDRLGTTLRGIGPAYTDKVARSGLRMESTLSLDAFVDALEFHFESTNQMLEKRYAADPINTKEVIEEYTHYAHQLSAYVGDVSTLLTNALRSGKRILAEGAQGTLLDLDHGTYPFVTSSNPTAAGALVGLGLGLGHTRRVIGVTKAFQTRVGEGPFPTEVSGKTADRLRGTGENPWDEFGTTTGRPRRVGWLDAVLLRYAVRINGLTELVLTKLDVLTGLDPLHICVAYKEGDQIRKDLPFGPTDLSPFQPVFEELPGWREDVRQSREWDDLPAGAKAYIQRIEALTDIPVKLVSVGPERDQVVKIA